MAEAKTKEYEVVRTFGLGEITGEVGQVVRLNDDQLEAIGGVRDKKSNPDGFVVVAKKGAKKDTKDDE